MSANDWTRVLFEAIDDAVLVHDERGNILEANPAACRRLGYSRDEMLDLNTRDIDVPEFAAGFHNRLQSQLMNGVIRCEGVHRTKDGRRIAVDINTSAIHLDGKPAILAVIRDITQRKQTEDILAKQSQLLQSILDNMSDAVLVVDANQHIILFNPPALRIFGAGLIHGSFTLHPTGRIGELGEFPVSRCVQGESFDGLEILVRHAEASNGTWISVAGHPLREGGIIRGAVLVCHDISKRRRNERRIKAQFDLARVIAANRDFDESCREILHILCDVLDFEVGILWQVDSSHQAVSCLQTWHQAADAIEHFLNQSQVCVLAPTADLVGVVCQEGQSRHYPVTESAWSNAPRWRSAQQAGLSAVLAFPIQSGAATIGALELWGRRIAHPDDFLLSTTQAMANQIGQFLERQQMEQELRDSQALYASLVQSLPQNIFRKDRAGRVTFANTRYCATLKQSLSRLLGKTDFDLFPAPLAKKYVADDRRILQSGQTLDTIEEHQLPDGEHLYVHVVKTPVRNADDEIVGVQGIFWDVTQEVRSNQAIAASEKRYRQLAEATLDGIVVIDRHGNITLFNPAAERMFGYRANEIVGLSAAILVPKEFHQLHEERVARYLDARLQDSLGKPQEFKARRKDGSDFPVEIALSLLSDSAGGPHDYPRLQVLAAIRDLTERNKMRAVLVQNEKLASIGLLSAGVAHEINNPLAFVGNNLAVLERDCKGLLTLLEIYGTMDDAIRRANPGVAECIRAVAEDIDLPYIQQNLGRLLNRTRDGIDRVTRIVHSLRGMARTEALHRQDVRLPDLINASLEIVQGNFKRLGVFVEQTHDARPVVSCVSTQISQVILNFLINAFQAIEAARQTQGRITIRSQRQGAEMLLEIKDNGTGIQPEHLAKLFDPFFTTKDVGAGTGLGLSISHHIVTAHGGRIEVESQPGQETCFRIYLPAK